VLPDCDNQEALPLEIFTVRIVARNLNRTDSRQPGKPERKTTSHTTIQTAEISIKEPVLLQIDHQATDILPALLFTEGAVRAQVRFFFSDVLQMTEIKKGYRLTLFHAKAAPVMEG